MARPRVFVSSTYYDLKYVRERLERFISAYCFDPILFESDEVFFNPNTPLDESCYKEVENCHMMILIVGGRYGSLASEQKEKYEKQYISITRKEYETARKKGIPVMVFVEQNVFAEYKTYMANQKKLPDGFKYAFVDDARVFDFISNLEQGAIKIFGKIDDIEHYFSHQIAGMLLSYLKQLQDNKTQEDIKNAVEQLNIASSSMQKMLNLIGGKVLEDTQKEEYDNLILQQRKDLIDFFFTIFKQNFTIKIENRNVKSLRTVAKTIYNIILDTIFNIEKLQTINKESNPIIRARKYRGLEQQCVHNVIDANLGCNFNIEKRDYRQALIQVLDIIQDNEQLKDYFKEQLSRTIDKAILINRFYLSFNEKDEADSNE